MIPNNSYTVVMLFKLDDVSGYKRVLDLKNGTSDNGGYIKDGRTEFENLNNIPIEQGTYIQVVVVRDSTGLLKVYRDGTLRVQVNDVNGDFVISPDNVLRFFQDDFVDCCEASAGNVARIRLWDVPFATAQVQALDRLASSKRRR